MNHQVVLITLVLLVMLFGCASTGSVDQSQQHGLLSLSFTTIPPATRHMIARLTREGFTPREVPFPIFNANEGTTLSVGDVPAGTWHLIVDALSESGEILYTGATDVRATPGQNTSSELCLLPANEIKMVVTWEGMSANLLVNGSFETGPEIKGTHVALNPGSTEIQGWVVTRQPIDYVTVWEASHGVRCIDLNGTPSTGGIAQTFTTIPGRRYRVRFALASNPDGPPTIKRLAVAAAGSSTEFTVDITGRTTTKMGWEMRTWEFIASQSQTTLEFYSVGTPTRWGPAIDNVSVEEIN